MLPIGISHSSQQFTTTSPPTRLHNESMQHVYKAASDNHLKTLYNNCKSSQLYIYIYIRTCICMYMQLISSTVCSLTLSGFFLKFPLDGGQLVCLVVSAVLLNVCLMEERSLSSYKQLESATSWQVGLGKRDVSFIKKDIYR